MYSEKYNNMVQELRKLNKYGLSFVEPKGGLSIWIRLPEDIDSFDLYKECTENNVALCQVRFFL